jgi:hypothetical protein
MMPHCSSRLGRRLERLPGSFALSTALACAAQPPTHTVEPTAARMTARESSEPAASAEPKQPSRSDASADRVVTLIAKPGLWPLDVESARRVLQALGPVTREQPTPNDLSLVGGPFGALDRFDVDYSLDDGRYWVFGSAGFLLGDRDPVRLYRAVETRLTQLLGKPASTDGESGDEGAAAELPTVTWDLGEAVLSLAPSSDGGEPRVMIAIHESAP